MDLKIPCQFYSYKEFKHRQECGSAQEYLANFGSRFNVGKSLAIIVESSQLAFKVWVSTLVTLAEVLACLCLSFYFLLDFENFQNLTKNFPGVNRIAMMEDQFSWVCLFKVLRHQNCCLNFTLRVQYLSLIIKLGWYFKTIYLN